MECPRCGSSLERYTLGERSTVTCGECRYIGVPVDHHGQQRTAETWADALSRISDASHIASVTIETTTGDPSLELVFGSRADDADSTPKPTIVRVERPDPALAAALEAADGADDRIRCTICGKEFDRQAQLYGHLAVHAGERERTD